MLHAGRKRERIADTRRDRDETETHRFDSIRFPSTVASRSHERRLVPLPCRAVPSRHAALSGVCAFLFALSESPRLFDELSGFRAE